MGPAREASQESSGDLVAAFERAGAGLRRTREALAGVIFGQDASVETALAVMVAGGGAVIAGAPGSAKTRLVQALGAVFGLPVGRIRFTPDLELEELIGEADARPALDASGAPRRRAAASPLFNPLVLAEDLDRAAPRVRSAVLEAAHEGQVMVGGAAVPLPRPFHLLATTTDPEGLGLGETETDRFLAQIDLGAPDRGGERRMLIETSGRDAASVRQAMDVAGLIEAQRVAVELPVGEKVVEAILDLVRRARPDDPSAPPVVRQSVARGPGPRAGQALMRLARARALIDGRASPSAADVKALALPVLKPRLEMHVAHGRKADAAAVIAELVAGL
jgi:MoxR-like ATPase